MERRDYSRLGEELYHAVLKNGLHLYVDRKPGFQKNFAFFATNYGGMDMKFRLNGQWKDTPAGVAHFLEHKMFDTKDGNALQMLASNGASPNACTSSAITGYYFESTEKFYENLRILLSFVSIPYFTQESVDKEQGIIGQEIRMEEDDPDNRVFFALMECLFDHHPIQVPIAGSQESISHITADTLYACHQAFYCPNNMVLTVAGDVDPEQVLALVEEILPAEPGGQVERDYGGEEDGRAAGARKELHMEVSAPIFYVGFKGDVIPNGQDRLRQRLLGDLASEALFGSSSPLYAKLYNQGLINKKFGCAFEVYPGCSFLCAGGESPDPDRVRDAILAEADRIAAEGIEEDLFRRLKKGCYGAVVRGLNAMDYTCIELAQGHFGGYDFLTFPEAYDSITKTDVEACLRAWATRERCGLAIISPKGAEE